jgi:SAM-dependent methyltransferase
MAEWLIGSRQPSVDSAPRGGWGHLPMSETPQPNSEDLAALMAEIQALQPPARIPAARLAEMAREVLDIGFDPDETRATARGAASGQRALRGRPRVARTAAGRQASTWRGWRPKREFPTVTVRGRIPNGWLAAIRGLLLRHQETFNSEVARALDMLTDAAVLRQQQAALGHLVASTNTLVRRLTDVERAAAERGRALADLFQVALERVAAAEPETAPRGGPALTADDRETLRSLVASASEAAAGTAALRAELARHVAALTARVEQVERLQADLARALETRTAAHPEAAPSPPARRHPAATPELADGRSAPTLDFKAFEAATRGDEQRIAREQSAYVAWFKEAPGRVLDAGCGRGEFLGLLREAGVTAYGIDSDPNMVAHCQAKGLEVREGSLVDHLDSLGDASLGGVFLGHVVEHLPMQVLLGLPALLHRKIAPGGGVVIETINPMCLTTFSGAMYADPTHQRPVHPKALEFLLGAAGFGDIKIVFNAPVPPEEALQPLVETAPLEPALKDLVLQANRNIERLNALLYSYANYAVLARKPA